MGLTDDFVSVADSSAFIFVAKIAERGNGETRTDGGTVTAVVSHVLKAPAGMGGLVGREVTVHVRSPLSEGTYVIFADPVSVGTTLTVRETAHLDGRQREDAEAAIRRGYEGAPGTAFGGRDARGPWHDRRRHPCISPCRASRARALGARAVWH